MLGERLENARLIGALLFPVSSRAIFLFALVTECLSAASSTFRRTSASYSLHVPAGGTKSCVNIADSSNAVTTLMLDVPAAGTTNVNAVGLTTVGGAAKAFP